MDKNIAKVGDILVYTGCIPNYVMSGEREFINDSLEIGKLYEVIRVGSFSDGVWYKINDYNRVWAPMESFDVKLNRSYIKEKYGLK